MPSKTKNKIRDAIRMVLVENRGRPLDCERIMTTINGNLEHYNVKEIKDSKSIQNAVYRKDCTDLEMKNRLVYIVEGSNIIENNQIIIQDLDECNCSDIKTSITKNLVDDIKVYGDMDQFCHGIQNITYLLKNWYDDQFVSSILGCFRRKLKVILGTREEVIELRKAFKGLESSEVGLLKLEIINHISSKNTCENIHKLDELYENFKEYCNTDGRYAYYVPIECEGGIQGYPVSVLNENISNQIFNYKCIIHEKDESWDSDYIVMPYDVEENSRIVFSPQFYQALYHELYHFLVINNYRGSKAINEGSPELYSEICYKQFLYDFISLKLKHDDLEIKKFFSEYMRFSYKGSYKPYYDYVKNEMLSCLELDEHESISYDMFCDYVSALFAFSSNDILKCKDPTPNCDSIFKDAIEGMCSRHHHDLAIHHKSI